MDLVCFVLVFHLTTLIVKETETYFLGLLADDVTGSDSYERLPRNIFSAPYYLHGKMWLN